MAILRKRKIRNRYYYYIEHSFKHKGKGRVLSKYIGSELPRDIDKLKKEVEFEAMRKKWKGVLLAIKRGYFLEIKKMPKLAIEKYLEHFVVEFTYNSNKIEGSKLSLQDTASLLYGGISPRNKPLKDVKEAEGHKKAIYDMFNFKGNLTLKKICQWHTMIFENSEPIIAGKIRLHRIMVTGSRVSFPYPDDLPKLLKEFIAWYSSHAKKYNPVELAALAHLEFVTIHPFTDGNGRISRLLANYILYKNKYPMANIKFGDRKTYYKNLEESQLWEDDYMFVRFFIKKYIKYNKEYTK